MFVTHPIELTSRRQRCRPLMDELSTQILTTSQPICNVCGCTKSILLAVKDRYGFPIKTVMCENCGLIYLLDRFSQNGYSMFYAQGYYRQLIEKFFGVRQKLQTVESAQSEYTSLLITSLKGYLDYSVQGKKILDIGGSTGVTARKFEQEFGFKATVLEPSAEEARMARTFGLNVEQNTIENWATKDRFDVILLCRTFEHLYDLKLTFGKIYDLLTPNGLFFCDIADFIQVCSLHGAPDGVTKMDHCYWIHAAAAKCVFAHLGFDIHHTIINLPDQNIGYVLRKMEKKGAIPGISTDLQMKEIMDIQKLWYLKGLKYYDFRTWARRAFYRFRRNIRKKLELGRT